MVFVFICIWPDGRAATTGDGGVWNWKLSPPTEGVDEFWLRLCGKYRHNSLRCLP